MSARLAAVVLAGGEGRRLGGVDKGLQIWRGRALIDHLLERLRAQQDLPLDALAISANRHLEDYRQRGLPVRPDAPEHAGCGPLAGMAQALRFAREQGCAAVWLTPCDTPDLPTDLGAALWRRLEDSGAPAVAPRLVPSDAGPDWQPTHALLRTALLEPLEQALARGQRKVLDWLLSQGLQALELPRATHAAAFLNLNRPQDWEVNFAQDGGAQRTP